MQYRCLSTTTSNLIYPSMKKVAVIGAGAAGLCCARHFSKFPEQFHIQMFEQSQQVGGTWVYCAESGHEPQDVREAVQGDFEGKPVVHSSMYKNLRTNLPKEIMLFPDFPFDAHLPSYPYHNDVLDYLKHYMSHYQLHRRIKFGTLVEQVVPVHASECACDKCKSEGSCKTGDVSWLVVTCDVSSGQRCSEVYDVVLVCNGHFFNPRIPDIPGLLSFPGKVTHSHVYREPELYTSQSVLVVGAGQSGRDLLIDLSSHAKKVYFCNRGEPVTCKLPENVEELPAISEVRQDGVVLFSDGRERKVESIILATGYLYSFPFLSEDSGIQVIQGKRVFPLYKQTINAVHPSMAVIGINFSFLPFQCYDLQVRWVLSLCKGDSTLPSKEEMIRDVEETYQMRLKQGLPPHKAGHYLGDYQWDLYKELARFSGSEPPEPKFKLLFNEAVKRRLNYLITYKKVNLVVGENGELQFDGGENPEHSQLMR